MCSSWKIVVSEWQSVIAVSPNVSGGVRLIKPAKLYVCMQTHYKHEEDGCTALGVPGHGSVPLSHSGNVITRILFQIQTPTRAFKIGWLCFCRNIILLEY